jgi:hypothetical protein
MLYGIHLIHNPPVLAPRFRFTLQTMTQRDPPPSPDATASPDLTARLPEQRRQALALAALREVLRPAARLMIANGVQLSAIVEVLKQVLVLEAEEAGAGERSSDTRISVLTGVHRKDVKRLAGHGAVATDLDADLLTSTGSQVVARWLSDARYLDADGAPLRLARTPRYAADESPSFSELVAAVSTDVGARAVLEGLMRLDAVRAVDETTVELRLRAFVPSKAARESLHFLAANVADHLASAVHNQAPLPDLGPMLEQSAFSQGLTGEQAERLHQFARGWWEKALKQFLQQATLAESYRPGAGEPVYRVRFGVYFHQAAHEAKRSSRAGTGAVSVKTPRK